MRMWIALFATERVSDTKGSSMGHQ